MNKKIDMSGCVIQDATRPLEIEITMESVTAAECSSETDCVIAQAILAKFPGVARGVSVGHYYTKVIFDGYVLRYKNPSALTRGLKAFDLSKDANGKGKWSLVPIGVYTILPPARTERLGRDRTKKSGQARKARSVAAPETVYTRRPVTRCPVQKTSNRQAKQANKKNAA